MVLGKNVLSSVRYFQILIVLQRNNVVNVEKEKQEIGYGTR